MNYQKKIDKLYDKVEKHRSNIRLICETISVARNLSPVCQIHKIVDCQECPNIHSCFDMSVEISEGYVEKAKEELIIRKLEASIAKYNLKQIKQR